jgi:Cu-Zn family superoxide dismutase
MKMFSSIFTLVILSLISFLGHAQAATQPVTTTVYMVTTDGLGDAIGSLKFSETKHGLKITPDLSGLTPGKHGFHIHENADCSAGEKAGKMVAGLGAGGHFDPEHTGHHMGPDGKGHMGDLPNLIVEADGAAKKPLVAHHLKLEDVIGHSAVIHANPDNYTDEPPLGGSGTRIACAVILQ